VNLLDLDEVQRKPFARLTAGLVRDKGIDPQEIFLNVLESEEAIEMNYWMTKVLVQDHFVSSQQEVAKDAAGEIVKPLQAACLLKNAGMLAALLELNAFQGSLTDREFQLAARIVSEHEDQGMMGLLMKYAQEQGSLEIFMKELQSIPLQ